MSFWYLQFSQKPNEKVRLYYYVTSSRIVFVRFLGELKTPKRHFEINWPLEYRKTRPKSPSVSFLLDVFCWICCWQKFWQKSYSFTKIGTQNQWHIIELKIIYHIQGIQVKIWFDSPLKLSITGKNGFGKQFPVSECKNLFFIIDAITYSSALCKQRSINELDSVELHPAYSAKVLQTIIKWT